MSPAPSRSPIPRWLAHPSWVSAALILISGTLLAAQSVQSWLASRNLATEFVSPSRWMAWAAWFSGKSVSPADAVIEISFGKVVLAILGFHVLTWLAGTALLVFCRKQSWNSSALRWMHFGGLAWCLVGLWDWGSLGLQMAGAESLVVFWGLISAFWCAGCLSLWMTAWFVLAGIGRPANRPANGDASFPSAVRYPPSAILCTFIVFYVAVFATMNFRLYFNLLIPHGDSAMYEEHLWNILHGKGFRSYLDQGLFLGEHIQFVHLALIPIYILFPSHLTLEFCESLALALGAFPVYWMARRHTQSNFAGLAASAAYLLYPPMQFLDIEIDLKTFRPEAFGIPIFLLTLDQVDRRNLWGTLAGILGCLTVKEDYAIVLAPLGLWIAVFGSRAQTVGREAKPSAATDSGYEIADRGWRSVDRSWLVFGLLLAFGSVLYLYLATRVLMPWFRSGAEIHYANYFRKFGETPEQIVRTMLTNPSLLFGGLLSTSTALYALAMLVPVAILPLLSPSRIAVGLPLFGILCLNELARDPRHQFHAPLVPIVFWALAGGLPRAIDVLSRWFQGVAPSQDSRSTALSVVSHLAWTSSLATGIFFSLNPTSLVFWDAGSEVYWKTLYGPSRRAEEFAKIADLIPRSARVASTDFVHPRYTHHERSYDYSKYLRKVSGYEQKVPADTDYIVIDTQHRYSEMKKPSDVPEYRDHADEWELAPDPTNGYFIVLKRR